MSGKDFLKSHVVSWRRKVYSDQEERSSAPERGRWKRGTVKGGTGKLGTKTQGWKTQDWKTWDHLTGAGKRGTGKRGTLKVWKAWRNISAVTMLRQGVFEQWFAMWAPALLWDVRQRGWTSGSWLTHLPQRHSDDHAFVLTSYKTWITFSFTVLLCALPMCCMCYLLWSIINF